MKNIKVKGYSSLKKTLEGAVINDNDSEYKNYLRLKQNEIKREEKIKDLEKEVQELKSIIYKMMGEK